MSQNLKGLLGPLDRVNEPALIPKSLCYGIAKRACVRDNESNAKV